MDPLFKDAKIFTLDGKNLTIESIFEISHSVPGEIKLEIAESSLKKMKESRKYILETIKENRPVYGINTGFGILASKHIATADLEKLQVNLIRSHSCGVGKAFSVPLTRAMMLLRTNCLISGHSGINPDIVFLLLDLMNYGVTPIVPEKGSVGASGDLAPLSHIALTLIGEGHVSYQNKVLPSHFALNEIGKKPVVLGPKDGLALINGTAVMAGLGAMALYEAKQLMKIADISGALSLEASRGTKAAFDMKIARLKPHPGQLACTKNVNILLEQSEIINSHANCEKVQDPYSLRCIPQVHGACRQTVAHAESVINIELESVTDNPLIFWEENEVLSGGNFHGEAIALCMDYLAMGLAELANICERRIEKMINPHFSDLPIFLSPNPGLNSGLMMAHVTAAALVSENKILCHPASVDSIPTNNDKEDHVSMGVTSGRKLHDVLHNLKHCLAIELLCNTQAFEFLRPLKSSPALESVYKLIRQHVPPIEEDRIFAKDIKRIATLIDRGEILKVVENITGKLA